MIFIRHFIYAFYKYAIYKEFKQHIDGEYEGYRNHFRFNNLYKC